MTSGQNIFSYDVHKLLCGQKFEVSMVNEEKQKDSNSHCEDLLGGWGVLEFFVA